MRRRFAAIGAGVLTLALTGCSGFQGLYSVPLPGGADLGSHPITVTAAFRDVLDLVPQSAVKIGNVPVGRVSRIALGSDGRTAEVTMTINGDVQLPANAVASIEQTSLLGEKYIDLAKPATGDASDALRNGSRIDLSHTREGVEVEQVFGALSLLLNGGGLEQIQTITNELNTATDGHASDYRDLLTNLNQTIGQLDQHKDSITRALDAVNQLAANLQANTGQIQKVLDSLSPGLQILADERDQFVGMLDALNRLSAVTVSTLDASKDDIVTDLNNLAPILSQLAAAGSALPDSLQVLLTYPFPDAVLSAIKGDYLNGFIVLNLTGTIIGADLPNAGAVTPGAGPAGAPTFGTTSITPPPSLLPPTSSVTPGVPSSTIVTTGPPSGSASGSPSGSPSSGSGSPTGSPSGSGSGTGTGSASPTGSATTSGSTSGTPTASGRAGG